MAAMTNMGHANENSVAQISVYNFSAGFARLVEMCALRLGAFVDFGSNKSSSLKNYILEN